MEKFTPFKELDKKQKLQYIWDYYRWHIIVTIIILFTIISTVRSVVSHKDPALSIIMINADHTKDGSDINDFFEAQGISLYDGILDLSNTITFGENAQAYQYSEYAVLMTYITAGEEDLFFGNGETYEDYNAQGLFIDLRTVLDEETLSSYDLLYSTAEDHVDEYPSAIKLPKEANICQKGYYPEGDVYVGILYNAPHKDLAIEFLKYAMKQ